MEFLINRKSGVPIYKQVKSNIVEKIRSGELKAGFKMPTERVLSDELKVSRNTVSTAYKELEKDGLLVSYQGKGTFVAEESMMAMSQDLKSKVTRFVDLGLEEAIQTGMEPIEFLKLVEERVKEKVDDMRTSNAVYIECNVEQAKFFAKQLEEGTGMHCVPLTIADLIEMNDDTRLTLYNSKVIVSTFNHVAEVLEYTDDFNIKVLGVAINPDLATVVKIARRPINTKFAFVTISEEFKLKTRQALIDAGLSDIDIEFTCTSDSEELKNIVLSKDIIIVSPGRNKEVLDIVQDPMKIIRFEYNLDDGLVQSLKSKLLELNIV